jgi:hypothetical protein
MTVYVVEIDRYYKDGVEVTWAGTDREEAFKAAGLQIEENWESVCVMEFTDGDLVRTWYYGGSGSSRPGKKLGWIEYLARQDGQ